MAIVRMMAQQEGWFLLWGDVPSQKRLAVWATISGHRKSVFETWSSEKRMVERHGERVVRIVTYLT